MTKILMATTEAVPFAKTGGLADVCGALPIELARLGHEVTLFMPAFRQVFENADSIQYAGVDLEISHSSSFISALMLSNSGVLR